MPTRPALSAMRWADSSLEGRQAPATVLGEEVDSPNLERLGFAVNLCLLLRPVQMGVGGESDLGGQGPTLTRTLFCSGPPAPWDFSNVPAFCPSKANSNPTEGN